MTEFKAKLAEAGVDLGLDLQVQVLTTGSWPTQTVSKCSLPRELEVCCEEFKKFYLTAHSGRKLTWQTNMGSADLRAYFSGSGKKHELSVSTHQVRLAAPTTDVHICAHHRAQGALVQFLITAHLLYAARVKQAERVGRDAEVAGC